MKKIKTKDLKLFWRSFCISGIVIFCLFIGLYGAGKAYENTLKIGFGKEQRTVEITKDGIRIFDFTIKF